MDLSGYSLTITCGDGLPSVKKSPINQLFLYHIRNDLWGRLEKLTQTARKEIASFLVFIYYNKY